MNATESYKAGRLQHAVEAQIQEVRNAPGDHGKRLFLFELLAFSGDWDRAARQIDAVKYDDAETDTAVRYYAGLIDSERARRKVLSEGAKPMFLVEPPESVQQRIEALRMMRENRHAEARQILDEANTAVVAGKLNDKPITSLRDCDDVFGGLLEVMAHGDYYWLPLEQVDVLVMKAPKFPRDLIWAPARLEVRDGPSGDVFIPALYPFSHEHAADQIKLGRATDWVSENDGPVRGVGLRTFLADDDSISLLEWRSLEVDA